MRARGRELDERRGKHLVTLYLPTVCCGLESLLALQPPCVGLAPLFLAFCAECASQRVRHRMRA